MKEYTITFTAEVTKVIKSDVDTMEEFLVNDAPKFLCDDIKRKLPVDDVRVSEYKVFVGAACEASCRCGQNEATLLCCECPHIKVFVGDENNG